MKSSSQAVPVMAILMLVLLVSPSSLAAVTCGGVLSNVSPCLSYLTTGSGMPPPPCCAGAKALAASCTSTADRQTACGCLKTASRSLNVKPALARALPGNCQINLGFAVDPNIDCSTYVFQLAISLKLFFTSGPAHMSMRMYRYACVERFLVLYWTLSYCVGIATKSKCRVQTLKRFFFFFLFLSTMVYDRGSSRRSHRT